MLRRRKRKIQAIKELDAFPKTSEECIKTSTSGGTLSLLSFAIMIWLVIWECTYYLETRFVFRFDPDANFKEKLKINVDVTVAMPCTMVGADVLDVTGHHVMSYGDLVMEDTWFELDTDQLAHFQGIQRANSYLREEFHAVHEILWRSGYINLFGGAPRRRRFPKTKKNACKITGSLTVNKVAGNFHITAGKSIPLPIGHAHVAVFMDDHDYNFSHRIEKFSFGDPAPGIIHPLEGDELVTQSNMKSYQYFLTVVPTRVNTYTHVGSCFQYSVTELSRDIAHDKGSHGTPGIFFRYDVSALKVDVTEEHEPFLQFITRLIGIIGGVFTCSGIIHKVTDLIASCVFCRYFRRSEPKRRQQQVPLTKPLSSVTPPFLTSQSPILIREEPAPNSTSIEGTSSYDSSLDTNNGSLLITANPLHS